MCVPVEMQADRQDGERVAGKDTLARQRRVPCLPIARPNPTTAEHFPTVDAEVGDELFWYIFEREPRARDGFVELPDVPGLGLTVNRDPLGVPGDRMTRLIQLSHGAKRRVAVVEEPQVRLLRGPGSVYALALQAIEHGQALSALVQSLEVEAVLDYDPIYQGDSEWRLLPPLDHPEEPARCLVSGTGLTHLGSASDRQAMHHRAEEELTDSMRMFRWGLEAGRPEPGCVGVPPEWFFKGNGTILRAHGEPLVVPAYAEDGGEEAELAGAYIIGPDGTPYRLGLTIGNEFSDHRFERKNYLNLAGSKIRTCSIGPELTLDPDFRSVPGRVSIERGGSVLWSREIRSGEAEMCHSLQNLEHHHFKYETHRRPGDVHVHFFGAHSLSFGEGLELADGDVMVVRFEGYGRPLQNPVAASRKAEALVRVQPLA